MNTFIIIALIVGIVTLAAQKKDGWGWLLCILLFCDWDATPDKTEHSVEIQELRQEVQQLKDELKVELKDEGIDIDEEYEVGGIKLKIKIGDTVETPQEPTAKPAQKEERWGTTW